MELLRFLFNRLPLTREWLGVSRDGRSHSSLRLTFGYL